MKEWNLNPGRRGFTLVETLVAMALVSAVLLPGSFWLYGSRTSQAARERFRALQLLEVEMNRSLVLHLEKDVSEEIPGPPYLRLEIRSVRDGSETRLLGSARDRQGRVVTRLEAAFFPGRVP